MNLWRNLQNLSTAEVLVGISETLAEGLVLKADGYETPFYKKD